MQKSCYYYFVKLKIKGYYADYKVVMRKIPNCCYYFYCKKLCALCDNFASLRLNLLTPDTRHPTPNTQPFNQSSVATSFILIQAESLPIGKSG